jgi:hypothetical protein
MLQKIASNYIQKISGSNPYETYNTLLKYHSTGPDEGKTPKESANYHLAMEVIRALQNNTNSSNASALTGNFNFSVLDGDAPLGSRLNTYAKDFMEALQQNQDVQNMQVYWDKDGDIAVLRDLLNKRIKLNQQKYKHIADISDDKKYRKALQEVLKSSPFTAWIQRSVDK